MAQVGERQLQPAGERRRATRRFFRRRAAVYSLAGLMLIIAATATAGWSAPFGPSEQHLDHILQPPGREFLLGGSVAVISCVVGTLVGLVAGYYGGRVDSILMRFTDTLLALPALMVVILAARILGDGVWDVVLVLAGISWMVPVRIVRGKVLALKEREFVEAARALGLPDRRIMYRHLLPNLVGEVMVTVSLTVAAAILAGSTV